MDKIRQAFQDLQTQPYKYHLLNETPLLGYFTNSLILEFYSPELTKEILETASMTRFTKQDQYALNSMIFNLEEKYNDDYAKEFTTKLINQCFAANENHDATNFDELTHLGQVVSKLNDAAYQAENSNKFNYITLLSGIIYIKAQHELMFDFLAEKGLEIKKTNESVKN